jgi:hypothetical protein
MTKKLEAIESRVDALERRVDAMFKETEPKQPKEEKTVLLHRTSYVQAEPSPLEPLTSEEKAFLLSHGIDEEQSTVSLHVHLSRLTQEDRSTLEGLKKKRACRLTYHQ